MGGYSLSSQGCATRRSIPQEANAEAGAGSERAASTGLRRSKIVTMNKKIFHRLSSNQVLSLGTAARESGRPTMPMDELQGIGAGYLAYIVGPKGQFLWSKEFAAPDDDAAIEIARKFGVYVELWCGKRFVVKIRPQK
jgi:hypothetical protein